MANRATHIPRRKHGLGYQLYRLQFGNIQVVESPGRHLVHRCKKVAADTHLIKILAKTALRIIFGLL